MVVVGNKTWNFQAVLDSRAVFDKIIWSYMSIISSYLEG